MSYERRGGYRRRHRDDYDDRRREVYESPDEKLKTAILKLGEVDAVEELPRLAKQIQEHQPSNVPNVSEGIRIGLTQQPYKIPYYAALIWLLHERPTDATEGDAGPLLGRLVLEDIWKGFQAYLDKLAWREIRLCIHLFAHLTVAGLVTIESMISLLQSFTSVLDEFGVSYGRAHRAATCAAEGLMISGQTLKPYSASTVTEIIGAIKAFRDTAVSARWLVHPLAKNYQYRSVEDNDMEFLEVILYVLNAFNDSDFAQTAESFPQPYLKLPELDFSTISLFVLPSCLVPPDIELDALSTETEDEAQIKKEEWPEYLIRLFDSEVSPDPNTPAGYAIRSALLDIISIFEINRKECARLLLEYPKWTLPGTFKPKPGAPPPPPPPLSSETGAEAEMVTGETEPVPGKDWQLESTIVETILGALLSLPEPSNKSIYYISLITELCKLSPSTVGPAVGKSIRKLYVSLNDGLDVEAARRFAEWFSVHMSNFGFQWVWKEWLPDLTLAVQHPKRSFMRRAVEFEIRLAYHDRIVKSLPEAMQAPDALVVSESAPGPDFEYDDPSSPHHDAAQSVLNLFRGRAKAEDVIAHLDTLKTNLETSDDMHMHVHVDALVRSIAVQSLLSIGSRSFSHLLNAIERYLPLLRSVSNAGSGGGGTGVVDGSSGGSAAVGAVGAVTGTGTGSLEAKADILAASAAFWKQNRQMVGIVFDKLMQYQIVEPTDVIAWTFANGVAPGVGGGVGTGTGTGLVSLNAWEWDLMRAALDKANGRVVIARRKVTALRKEEDETRATAKARANDSSMEVDADTKQEEATVDSPALTTAIKAFTILTREQKAALSRTLDGFVSCLVSPSTTTTGISRDSNPHTRTVIAEEAWNNRTDWDNDEWNAWETWGWYRQFCRAYSPYIRTFSNTLHAISLSTLEGSTDPAAQLMLKTWNAATGQDA